MQKQKTIAKWLAILLLCTMAVGSYLLYSALTEKSGNVSVSAGDSGAATETEEKGPVHTPYYTTLPRKCETVSGATASHLGGEGDDKMDKAVFVGDKILVFFSTTSNEYDLHSAGLALAVFDDGELTKVDTFSSGAFTDCKLTTNGVCAAVKNADGCGMYLFSDDGEAKAQIDCPDFDDGLFYLSGRSLWWFYIQNGTLRAAQILQNMAIQSNAFFIQSGLKNAEIKDVLPVGNSFAIILGQADGTDEKYTYAYGFEPNNGFTSLFQMDNLDFKQIMTAGGEDGYGVILVGDKNSSVQLNAFNSDFSTVSQKTLGGVTCGAAYPTAEGFCYVGNGYTISLCRHLDALVASKNGLAFAGVCALSSDGKYLLADTPESDYSFTLYKMTEDGYVEVFGTDDCQNPRLVSGDGVKLLFSSNSASGLCRANFGGSDVFLLSFPD